MDESLAFLLLEVCVSLPVAIDTHSLLDTISYFCTIVGIMRLGLVPFPISIRNSAVAVAHLVKESNISQLLVSPDPAMQHLASDAVAILRRDKIYLEMLPMIQFVDIADESQPNPEVEFNFEKLNLDGVACLLHSSGLYW